jgi:hypothetical protein
MKQMTEQILECLLAGQEQMLAIMKAKMETNEEQMMAEMKGEMKTN